MKVNSILVKLILLVTVVEFFIMVVLYEFFQPLHILLEKYMFLGPIIDTVILVSIISIAYSRVLKRPLDELIKVMDAVEKKDFSLKADERRKDELGVIATHFNRVTEKLQSWGSDLEQQVEQQTEEIKETNKEVLASNEELHATADKLRKANEELAGLKIELEKRVEELKKRIVELEGQIAGK